MLQRQLRPISCIALALAYASVTVNHAFAKSPTGSTSGLAASPGQKATFNSASKPVNQTVSSSMTLAGEINVLAGACTAAGISIRDNKLPTVITKVRMGTAAYYSGVAENDHIIQGQIGQNKIFLTIERGNQRFNVALQYTPDNLQAEAAKQDALLKKKLAAAAGGTTLASKLDVEHTPQEEAKLENARQLAAAATQAVDWQTLKNYEIVVMLDSSGSMQDMLKSPPISQWDWCCKEIHSLTCEAERLGSGNFTLCTYAGGYQMIPNCNSNNVMQILGHREAGGGTDLATPLTEVIDRHFRIPNRKPLLVVVVTDAEVSQEQIENILVDASHRLKSPKEARFLFLQIGNSGSGQQLAHILDDELTTLGASFDIVSSVTSDDLVSVGLRRGMIAALAKPLVFKASSSNKNGSGGDERDEARLNQELGRVRAELARIRAEKQKNAK